MIIADRSLTLRVYDASGVGREWTAPKQFVVDVEQTSSKRPNKATIQVTNFNDGAIGFCEEALLAEVVVRDVGLLYRGDIRTVRTKIEGEDWTTEIQCGDGGRAYRDATLSRSYAPGATTATVLADLAAAAGLAYHVLGALEHAVYESGHVVFGRVSDSIDEIVESLGAEWSIQDGAVQIVGADALATGGPLLSPGTGLIGEPERKAKGKGIALRAHLDPRLRPGRLFRVEARRLSAWLRATKIKHKAGSRGDPWQTDVEARQP